MKISEVKTAFKIADVEFVEGSTRLKRRKGQSIASKHFNAECRKGLSYRC